MKLRSLFIITTLAVGLAACGNSSPVDAGGTGTSYGSVPTTSPTVSASAASGNDNIGGSVTANMGQEPKIVVPSGPPPTSLETKDIVVGTGPQATLSSTVTVQYLGVNYATGKPFDSSWSRGQPATFSMAGVVPGFADGIDGMRVGGRREIVIPPDLGYGATGSPPAIGPNETLIFVVDLLSVQGSTPST